jgi:hypothetical protein
MAYRQAFAQFMWKARLENGVCPQASSLPPHVTEAFRHRLVTGVARRPSMTWSALNGQTLISLSSTSPHQQQIDKQLAKSGVQCPNGGVANLLDPQIALVEADEGHRDHFLIWPACLSQSKSGHEPAH